MYEFDQTALAGCGVQCLLWVGRPGEAAVAFEAGLKSLPSSCDRRGAQFMLGLAEARLASGEPGAAMDSATSAWAVFARRGSIAGLRGFRVLLVEAGHRREARALDEQVRAHLGPAA